MAQGCALRKSVTGAPRHPWWKAAASESAWESAMKATDESPPPRCMPLLSTGSTPSLSAPAVPASFSTLSSLDENHSRFELDENLEVT